MLTTSDPEWLEYLRNDTWMNSTRITNLTSLDSVVQKYSARFHGAVVYDPTLPSTASLASTAAGVEDLLPFCLRSNTASPTLYDRYVASGDLTVARWLNASMFSGSVTGSHKGDAYIWAKETWLDTGKANPTVMGYYLDYFWVTSKPCCGGGVVDYLQSTVSNQDYVMANRGFLWCVTLLLSQYPGTGQLRDIRISPATLSIRWEGISTCGRMTLPTTTRRNHRVPT